MSMCFYRVEHGQGERAWVTPWPDGGIGYENMHLSDVLSVRTSLNLSDSGWRITWACVSSQRAIIECLKKQLKTGYKALLTLHIARLHTSLGCFILAFMNCRRQG